MIKVAASITGAIRFVKGKGDVLENVVLTAQTRNERLTVDFPGQNKRAVFEPKRIVIETANGMLIEARDDPEKSFEGQQRETPWDDIHVAYFVGEALWTYLNTPFLYTHAGFSTEEISSIQVEGETWRRLEVLYSTDRCSPPLLTHRKARRWPSSKSTQTQSSSGDSSLQTQTWSSGSREITH